MKVGISGVLLLGLKGKSVAFVGKKRMRSAIFFLSSSPSSSSSLVEVERKFIFSNRSAIEDILRQENFALIQETTMVDWYFDCVEDQNDVGSSDDNNDDADVDDPCNYSSSDLPLIRQDHWLRYREILKQNNETYKNNELAKWQLKRGNTQIANNNSNNNNNNTKDGSTVYEEVEGIEAVQIAYSIIKKSQLQTVRYPDSKKRVVATTLTTHATNDTLLDGYDIPVFPIRSIGYDLTPLARIETRRFSWKKPNSLSSATNNKLTTKMTNVNTTHSLFSTLTIDLDSTPDGYNVGEVEIIVDDEYIENSLMSKDEAKMNDSPERFIVQAQEEIEQFLRILYRSDKTDHEIENEETTLIPELTQYQPPMGKLEHFLFHHRPRTYNKCIRMGAFPDLKTTSFS